MLCISISCIQYVWCSGITNNVDNFYINQYSKWLWRDLIVVIIIIIFSKDWSEIYVCMQCSLADCFVWHYVLRNETLARTACVLTSGFY